MKKYAYLPTFRYSWRHLPTGARGEREVVCESLDDFFALILRWNYLGRGTWEYAPTG